MATFVMTTLVLGALVTGHLAARALPEERRSELWTRLPADHDRAGTVPTDPAPGHPAPGEHHPPAARDFRAVAASIRHLLPLVGWGSTTI